MKTKEIDIFTICEGVNGNWFVYKNYSVIAGFKSKEHAEYFRNYLENESLL